MYRLCRKSTFYKLFFVVSFASLFIYAVLAFYTFQTAYLVADVKFFPGEIKTTEEPERPEGDLKYVLYWTMNSNESMVKLDIGERQEPFIAHNCSIINCYITTNKELLNGDYRNFDAVIIHSSLLKRWRKIDLPEARTRRQKYIFYSMKSSDDHPICNAQADRYFNLTWSYKLYSDIFNPFFLVRDVKGNIVAPSVDAKWNKTLPYLEQEEMYKFKTKSKAVAFVMNKCGTRHNRFSFAKQFQHSLKHHGLVIDIYGCGNLECPEIGCLKAIERDYYFYLVFEDSIAEDYVTKEVLKAYDNRAVPIVISGADLSKFLPYGSYVDGTFASPEQLTAIVEYSLKDQNSYSLFHRWRNYYRFEENDSFAGLCQICTYLNNAKLVRQENSYQVFRKWWYPGPLSDRCYPKSAEKYSEVFSYFNSSKRKS